MGCRQHHRWPPGGARGGLTPRLLLFEPFAGSFYCRILNPASFFFVQMKVKRINVTGINADGPGGSRGGEVDPIKVLAGEGGGAPSHQRISTFSAATGGLTTCGGTKTGRAWGEEEPVRDFGPPVTLKTSKRLYVLSVQLLVSREAGQEGEPGTECSGSASLRLA